MVFSFICDIKICVSVCNSVNFMNSFRIFVSISSAKGSKTFSVAWVSTVADRRICSVRLIMYSALLYELSSSSACFSICLSTQENINYFFFPLAILSRVTILVPEVSRSPQEEDKILLGQNVQVTL